MKKLYLSKTDKKLAGVIGGVAEYFNMDATVLRLAAVLLGVLTGIVPMVLAYIIAAVIVPERPNDIINNETVK
jgi:phage shock protein C